MDDQDESCANDSFSESELRAPERHFAGLEAAVDWRRLPSIANGDPTPALPCPTFATMSAKVKF
jgi:hypothetical protein